MAQEKRIRVLLTKPTQDCHDRGVRYLARRFSEAGFEVIFNNFLVADEIVATALQEAVDVIGVSSSSGGHMPVFEQLLSGLKARGMAQTLVIAGGIIPPSDVAALKRWGVAEVFGPGASAEEAIAFVRRHAEVA
jgi:methylmalonyl-CoA mutase C-terminal domain/subunit